MLWIAVKATQLDSALGSLPDGDSAKAIVPLLNGIDHVTMLRSRYPARLGLSLQPSGSRPSELLPDTFRSLGLDYPKVARQHAQLHAKRC